MATPVGPTSALLSTPSGALILRVWWETGSAHPFRARVLVVGPDGSTAELGTTADPSEALAIIHTWVDEFVMKAVE